MEQLVYKSRSEEDTTKLATKMAGLLCTGDTVFLNGNLGTGKTVFARALIRALSQNKELDVPSPTYTLVQTYDTPDAVLWHFDLYRIKNPEDIYELGWEDAQYDGISLIEWPERLENLAPAGRLDINFIHSDNDRNFRNIEMIFPEGQEKRFQSLKGSQ